VQGQVVQEHRCGGDVLSSLRKLRGAVGIHDDGQLDLMGTRPRAACNVMSNWLGVASGVHRWGRRLVVLLLA
jgi:hypothetical protein